MGLFKKSSWSSFDNRPEKVIIEKTTEIKYVPLPNPNPANYKILRDKAIKKYLIIEIQYMDCVNYEGRKILVFENCSLDDLKNQKLIDPHFSENKKMHSPIARFEPTNRGWNMACNFIKTI